MLVGKFVYSGGLPGVLDSQADDTPVGVQVEVDVLVEFAGLGPHPLEKAESLEQLRALAHGYKIKVGLTPYRTMKVDTPEDFEAFCASVEKRSCPEGKG